MTRICKCGCGLECKREYANGHNARGIKRSLETKSKLRAMMARRKKDRPDLIKKFSDAGHTPEVHAKISSALRGRVFSAEHIRKIGEASRGRIHSPETCAKMKASARRGPDHHNWTGASHLYPGDWNRTARQIRKRDGNICMECSTNYFFPFRAADVHHIDGVKDNCRADNLICLCRSCHKRLEYIRVECAPRLCAILSSRYGYIYD